MSKRQEIVKVLLNSGADITSKEKHNGTALTYALNAAIEEIGLEDGNWTQIVRNLADVWEYNPHNPDEKTDCWTPARNIRRRLYRSDGSSELVDRYEVLENVGNRLDD